MGYKEYKNSWKEKKKPQKQRIPVREDNSMNS